MIFCSRGLRERRLRTVLSARLHQSLFPQSILPSMQISSWTFSLTSLQVCSALHTACPTPIFATYATHTLACAHASILQALYQACKLYIKPASFISILQALYQAYKLYIKPASFISSLQASHQIGFMLTPSSSHLSRFFYLFFRFFVYLQTFKIHNTPRTSTGEAQEYEPPARSVPQLPAQAHRYIDATSAGGGSVSRRQWDDNVVYIVEL